MSILSTRYSKRANFLPRVHTLREFEKEEAPTLEVISQRNNAKSGKTRMFFPNWNSPGPSPIQRKKTKVLSRLGMNRPILTPRERFWGRWWSIEQWTSWVRLAGLKIFLAEPQKPHTYCFPGMTEDDVQLFMHVSVQCWYLPMMNQLDPCL